MRSDSILRFNAVGVTQKNGYMAISIKIAPDTKVRVSDKCVLNSGAKVKGTLVFNKFMQKGNRSMLIADTIINYNSYFSNGVCKSLHHGGDFSNLYFYDILFSDDLVIEIQFDYYQISKYLDPPGIDEERALEYLAENFITDDADVNELFDFYDQDLSVNYTVSTDTDSVVYTLKRV